ncbi:type VI secretion system tip protein VgrG [Massilia sp. IC2-278]|uniref:type VI secretion system Vgr family protein n=1 Tax=Massilia sp. IC2-278 TaxID=2887200 RepID=UPI001E29FEFA|nr:type VI secretion system Vgr family protein [Massilia sp. IC2-278]MCC2959282.1 type VI secretion system tip protein VgrG [Massilia sp. IC2-278]
MDSASEFLRVLQHERSLSTAHRALRLRLAHAEALLDDVLLPQRIEGSEAICGGLEYRVSCVASDATLPLKELIALPAEIQVVTDRGQLRSICGIVTEARSGDADGALATYQLVLRDALSVMEKRVNSRIFRYQNELEIVQVLFDEWRHANAVLAGAFEYELDPLFDMRLYPPREQTMQYNESDTAFVRRLLRRRGISWTVRPGRSRGTSVDPLHDRIPAHTLVLFADANHLPENAAGSVRYHRDDVTGERDTITHWGAARTLQPGSATRHSWDYKNPGAAQFMSTTARASHDQGGHGNGLAASLDDYLIDTPHAGNDVEDSWRLGQLRMQRHEFEAKCFHGEGSVRDFCAGQYFTLQDHPEIDTHPLAERQFVITEVQLSARNNLPGELSALAERLLAQNGWHAMAGFSSYSAAGSAQASASERAVRVRFTAVRRSVPIVPAYDPRVDLPHPQLQSAIVVGPQNEEVHCDRLGRVKIRFPGMRTADHEHAHGAGASGSAADSAWVRVASNWAGNGPGSQQQFGALTLPRVGTEVLVAFLGGDPDRPVILSQVFNQNGEPPALSANGGLPGNRYLSGLKSREIGGQRGNQLRFDDTCGEISAKIGSDHAHSELNLGWLARAREDGQGQPRGEGAELRSDKAVAVRGGQGILISAEQGEHEQLERAGLVGLAEVMQGVLEELERQAISHNEDEEAKPRLAELVDKLKRWHEGSNVAPGAGGAPIVAATGPAGVLVASEDNVAIGAQSKIDLVSVADTELSAGRNLFLRAARSLSMFAYSLGVKLVAGRGNIMLQTHQGNIEIKSAGRISLIAAEGIDLQAPEVKVVAQGAQTVWGAGSINQQCTSEHLVRAAVVTHAGAAEAGPAGLDLVHGSLETDERMVVIDRQTGLPAKGRRYIARHEDGTMIEGITDDEGRTDVLQAYSLGDIEFRLLPEESDKSNGASLA